MRLFISIYPPKEIKERVRDIARNFHKNKRQMRFVPMDQLHITLKFLGDDVSEESLNQIIDTFEGHKSEFKKTEISLDELVFGFERQIRPKVLLLQAEQSEALDKLTQTMHNLIKNLSISDIAGKKDRSKLIHHMTIARARPNVNRRFKKEVTNITKNLELDELTFTAKQISIIESVLSNKGPIYREAYSLKLS